MRRHFASDNNAGVHPEVLNALVAANAGHVPSYGADEYTAALEAVFRRHFGEETFVFPVFNGSAANTLALRHLTQPWEGILCASTAHIHVDECGALESVAGRKLLTLETTDGKLTPGMLDRFESRRGDVHHVQPRVVSIAQATEYGTVYTAGEVRAIASAAHERGMLLHMDGARLANAAVALGTDLCAVSRDAGVDVLAFGGTKNGLMGAEAVVFFDEKLAARFEYVRKQMLQLGSKMRFIAVQLIALLEGDLWARSARHANAMAARLYEKVRDIPSVAVTQKVETNAVFARVPRAAIQRLQSSWRFGIWNPPVDEVRWMTAFDTTEEDVDRFAEAIALECGRG